MSPTLNNSALSLAIVMTSGPREHQQDVYLPKPRMLTYPVKITKCIDKSSSIDRS